MILSLKNHPFSIEASLEYSLVVTFAISKEKIQPLIPECLALDLFHDKWAFVAIAMVETKGLRPKGFPEYFGNDFFLIGYRIFVTYTTNSGKRLRGLYILKSETDKKKMEIIGNLFTHYHYTTIDIEKINRNNKIKIKSIQSDFELEVEDVENDVSLPVNSPFADWKEARRFAGPLPFTFSYNSVTKKILIIEGMRRNWIPKPVKIIHHRFSFLNSFELESARLANAFMFSNIPYCWKKGKVEQWKK